MKKALLAIPLITFGVWSQASMAVENHDTTTAKKQNAVTAETQSASTTEDNSDATVGEDETYELAPVEVSAQGSGDLTFLNDKVSSGRLAGKTLLEMPYQVNTVSSDLMEDVSAMGYEDLIKFFPSAQINYRFGADIGRPQTRGMAAEVVSTFLDGFQSFSTQAVPSDLFSEIEITNGLAGTLYGTGGPSGIFNFIRKRPTDEFYGKVQLRYDSDAYGQVGAEISGRTGIFGIRVQAMKGDGETYAEDSDQEREAVALGLDIHLLDNLVIQNDYSYYDYYRSGYPGKFTMTTTNGIANYQLPDAVSTTTAGLGQEYAGVHTETRTASSKVVYDPADNWHLEAGYLFQRMERALYNVTNKFIDDDGDYTQSMGNSKVNSLAEIDSWIANIQTEQNLLGMTHKFSFGGNGYHWDRYGSTVNSSTISLGTMNINNPSLVEKDFTFVTSPLTFYKSGTIDQSNISFADSIELTEKWEAVLSVGESWIEQVDSGETSYDDNGESYAASIIFKPFEKFNIYGTYADNILQGSSGENSDGTEVVLDPIRSKQYELGLKTQYSDFDFSTAVFQIRRPIAYLGDDGIYQLQGDQVNTGLEVMTTWHGIDRLTVTGGFTWLDPEMDDAALETVEGKQVIGVPEFQGNIYADYLLPVLEDLHVNANFHYCDEMAIDPVNTQWTDAYYTVDLGVKYRVAHFLGKATTFRAGVKNVFDEEYWAGVTAAGSYATEGTSSSTMLFLGDPRTYTVSMTVEF